MPDLPTILSGIVIGLLAGLIANFGSWWLLFHGLSPTLRFSPAIGKTSRNPTPQDTSRFVFRVKLENTGRRDIIDVELTARLRLEGLEGYPKGLSQIVYISLDSNGEPVHRIPHIPPVRKSHSRPILVLCTQLQQEFKNPNNYPKEIVRKAKSKSLQLDDMLALGEDTYLQIIGFGYDAFSGARKMFTSKQYRIQDIQSGSFERNSVNVELPTDKPPGITPKQESD